MKKLKKLFRDEEGQVLVMFALLMTVLMGFAALVIDVGMGYVKRGELQNAADAAALAAASVNSNYTAVATSYAESNNVDFTKAGTKIQVVPATVAGKTSVKTEEKAYTPEELNEMVAEYEAELNGPGMTDDKLIELAREYSLTAYLQEPKKYDYNEVNAKSDDEIIQLALSHNLREKLDILTKSQYKVSLNSKSDVEIIELARKYKVYDPNDTMGHNKYKDDKKAAEISQIADIVFAGKEEIISVPTSTGARKALVDALVLKLNQINPVTTIIDKASLKAELVSIEKTFLEEQVIYKGTVEGAASKVKVALEEYVPFSFARILGIEGTTVAVDATAEKMAWAGDALPFLNLDGDAEKSVKGQPLEAWNKTGPGDKERISNNDLTIGENSIQVNYQDGYLEFKKGKVMSKVQEPLKNIAKQGNIVYLFSIKNSEISNYQKKASKELKNGDQVPLSDTVLLKCEVMEDWDGTGSDTIKLKFLESYDWVSGIIYESETGERPGSLVKLVE